MMKTLRRLTTTIVSSFDWMISQVENHDALVDAAIREVQQAGARATVQLKKVRQDGLNMRKRLQDLREAQELWSSRALQTAGVDEKRAIECLRRKKRTELEIASLEEEERQHAKIEKQLGIDLRLVEEKLETLKSQRNLLRTRQSRAEALRAAQGQDSSLIGEIDGILERWESKVGEYEAMTERSRDREDDFTHEFVTAEEESALKEELARLIGAQS